MAQTAPAGWLAEVFAPLGDTFGDRVRFARDGACAWWSFEGHHAIVELGEDGSIAARFLAPPVRDAVDGAPLAAVYAGDCETYSLTPGGCERMVADMLAFFSGVREPRFRFVDAR